MTTIHAHIPHRDSPSRNTLVRRMMLSLFDTIDHPLTAAEVGIALERHDLHVNKTTIYRQLDALSNEGYITALSFGTDGKRYEANHGGVHPHLLCTQCGRIECLPIAAELIDQQRSIAERHGFRAERCSLEFYGICINCQEGTEK